MVAQNGTQKTTTSAGQWMWWVVGCFGSLTLLGGVLVCGLAAGVIGYLALATERDPAFITDRGEAGTIGVQVAAGIARQGEPAPTFTLPDLDGNLVNLSDYEGQPVIINFWATWCGPCEAEMPELNDAYRQNENGLVILAVNLGKHPDTVRSFVEYQGLEFMILSDRDRALRRSYNTRAIPTTYFIDREGHIAHVFIGTMSANDIAFGVSKIE